MQKSQLENIDTTKGMKIELDPKVVRKCYTLTIFTNVNHDILVSAYRNLVVYHYIGTSMSIMISWFAMRLPYLPFTRLKPDLYILYIPFFVTQL